MRPYLRFLLLLFILLLGYQTIKAELGGHDFGLFEFQNLAFVGLLASTITALLIDFTYFRADKKILQFSISIIGIILCVITFYLSYQRQLIDDAKTAFKVVGMSGTNNDMVFEFKDGNKLCILEYNLLGHSVYYGSYALSEDTLEIINSNYTGFEKELPKSGVIRNDTVFWEMFDPMLLRKE